MKGIGNRIARHISFLICNKLQKPAELASQFCPRNGYDQALRKIRPVCSVVRLYFAWIRPCFPLAWWRLQKTFWCRSKNKIAGWIFANLSRVKEQIVVFFVKVQDARCGGSWRGSDFSGEKLAGNQENNSIFVSSSVLTPHLLFNKQQVTKQWFFII